MSDNRASLLEDPHAELIKGRPALPPSPMPIHQFLAAEVLVALRRLLPREYFLVAGQSVLIDHLNEPRPDVVVMRREGANRTPVLAADVLVAVEVVSPESAIRDRRDKSVLYALAGIPAYWVVDPLGEQVTFAKFVRGPGGAYRESLQTDGLVTIFEPWKVTLDLRGWTHIRDGLQSDGQETTSRV
jgi:Uma2 family endonuclease